MKKMLLAVAVLAGLGLFAHPAAAAPAVKSVEVLDSSTTCNGMTSSNSAGTSLFASPIYTYVSVENEDSSAIVYCNELSGVATSGAARGKKVRPGVTVTWVLALGTNWYCINDSGAPVNIMVCKGF